MAALRITELRRDTGQLSLGLGLGDTSGRGVAIGGQGLAAWSCSSIWSRSPRTAMRRLVLRISAFAVSGWLFAGMAIGGGWLGVRGSTSIRGVQRQQQALADTGAYPLREG
ncbi:MAG: hypothetical protein OHK0015_46910 [Chloroflexi bacterium OHK40]